MHTSTGPARPTPSRLELLAPARDAAAATAAILSGADAVYMGASSHGARAAAANSIDDIRRVADMAHPFGAKVYATVNTLVYDNELPAVQDLVWQLWRAGVDALIVQDMALLRMHLPPIDLHASTQCDIRTPAKARFLASAGYSRLVLPRELSLGEIEAMHRAVPQAELEAFIHGALCVSYSGDCRASAVMGGRSANRGECAQICRLPYNLTDAQGRVLVRGKHLLSLRDLNRSQWLESMAAAGVCSFKIEGRLKDPTYVANTVAWYSRQLDALVSSHPGLYARASAGRSVPGFTPDPSKSFNRGFTPFFITGTAPARGVASIDTPKPEGTQVGTVTGCDGRSITARLSTPLTNGDGLAWRDTDGTLNGFRLNRIDGNRLYPASPLQVPRGATLWRTRSKEWDDIMASARPSRTLHLDMALRVCPGPMLALELTDGRGVSATVTAPIERLEAAVTPQAKARRNILTKLGGTIYTPGQIADLAGDVFIPASLLASLRREGIQALGRASRITWHPAIRLKEDTGAQYPATALTVRDNVANSLARDFYLSHGVQSIAPAIEVTNGHGAPTRQPGDDETPVMCTRYCLRRELGHCLKQQGGNGWPPAAHYLESGKVRMRVEYDCRRCGMNLYHASR